MRPNRIAIAAVVVVVSVTFGIGAKRRSVQSARCTGPTLHLTVSPQVACPTGIITVTWRASDNKAVVSIDGIGDRLFSTGSARITDGRRTFTGYASNACAKGEAKSVSVTTPDVPAGSISGVASMRQFTSTTLRIDVSSSAMWSLSSSLANSFSPASGFGSDEVTYTASNGGTDAITLHIIGQCDATTDRVMSLVVERGSTTDPPPPPPGGGYLRCCDRTFSPTCKSCDNKRGCCSGHEGVCSCS